MGGIGFEPMALATCPPKFWTMGNAGIEPAAFRLWTERSTTELIAQNFGGWMNAMLYRWANRPEPVCRQAGTLPIVPQNIILTQILPVLALFSKRKMTAKRIWAGPDSAWFLEF